MHVLLNYFHYSYIVFVIFFRCMIKKHVVQLEKKKIKIGNFETHEKLIRRILPLLKPLKLLY